MTGLELSRRFYEDCGRPMLEAEFSRLLPYMAVGLFGSGSECFGYDDAVSKDHDFEPGFCVFLPGEDIVSRRDAFLLERAYAKLPKTFLGCERQRLLPVGGARHGIFRTKDFFLRTAGTEDGRLDLTQWLSMPEQALCEATNGCIFFDSYGEVSAIRERLSCFPEDIRLKRLAGNLLLMAQSGQYNYERCLRHREASAAQLALIEFVKSSISVIFLLNRRYQPFYKWVFRALRELPALSSLEEELSFLLTGDNAPDRAGRKAEAVEAVSSAIVEALGQQQLSKASGPDLEAHAYSVNDRITDASLRNLHILAAV